MTIRYSTQRHRGSTGATETPEPRRKYATKRRNLSFDAFRQREHEAKPDTSFEAFEAACLTVKKLSKKTKTMGQVIDRFFPELRGYK